LVGCGVSKEDYEKAVSELNKTKAELAQLKSQAGKPSPAEKPAVAEKPGTVDTGTQDKLAASQKETTECRAKVDSLTKENSSLKAMLDKLKAEYAELQKKLGGATQQLPSGLPKKP
jgi:predicted RNase H-like nuclease (RuvC/YqgF family)